MDTMNSGNTEPLLWYKDAIIYQLHIKSFYDADGDGVGDFAGLHQKLDHIAALGVNAIWLLPFFPSPRRDDGYDIADYGNVSPDYGTMEDFRAFVDAAHQRNIRVIIELVINHTSDQHPWFQRARQAPAARPNGISTSGRTAIRSFRKRASSSSIRRNPTGHGMRWPAPITGIVSIPTSRTSISTVRS